MHSTFMPPQTLSTSVPHETLSIRITLSTFLPPQTPATSRALPETLSIALDCFCGSMLSQTLTTSLLNQTLSTSLPPQTLPFQSHMFF
ncbi:hypothetical protein DEO72_LG1g2724 [Vigna unguiculata]|uniref:Uncharacterized protein n=1 Tax=Vigna unguiculata TaxID=3917 RepID=A0A4D6KM05_VIGUN|nr:hypothetical protein DEO72_LG1g2724 [Vigna unguiculata]